MRPSLVNLEHALHRNPPPAKMPGGSLSGEQPEAHLMKAAGNRRDGVLVEVVDRQENCALVGQNVFGRDLRFRKRAAERSRDSHDLTGGAHFWAEDWIEL